MSLILRARASLCLWHVPCLQSEYASGNVHVPVLESLQLATVQSSLQRPRDQGAHWSALCFSSPGGRQPWYRETVPTLPLPQPQNITQCLVPMSSLPSRVNQGQEDNVGSSRLLAERCFFVLTFFAFGAFLKRRDHKINTKDRPPIAYPFPRLERNHHKFSMLFYKCFMIQ